MIGRFLLCLPLLLLGGCPPLCFAQIALSEQKVQIVSGLDSPRIVGGVVMFDGPSRPTIEAAALVELKAEKQYKFLDIEAENVADFELGNLTKLDDTHWLLRGAGKYRLSALAFDPDLARARLFVELGPAPPPVPPGPTPTPTPTPTPDGEAPIPEPGFRVLVVYESSQEPPRWIGDADFMGYIESHCVKGPTGKPEWRILDPDVVVDPQLPIWVKALARPRKSVPWLLVSNGKTGWEGPLPATKEETLALLAKYAEGK